MSTTFAFPDTNQLTLPALSRLKLTMIPVNESLWRLTHPGGEVFGYVETFADPRGTRFRAKRFSTARQHFCSTGEFWRIEDAIDSLGGS